MKPLIKKRPIVSGFGENFLKSLNKKQLELDKKIEKAKTTEAKAELIKEYEGTIVSPLIKALGKDLKDGSINEYISFHLNAKKFPVTRLFMRKEVLMIFFCIFIAGVLTGIGGML